mmetsp:Transcript_28213/g.46723  ORF Transcript_28213/g.46723 Transcript_28213/m.46723 type:complete len:96 (+) Transcript_28213:323-610(+)
MLRSFGERFPRRPDVIHLIRVFLRNKRLSRKHTISDEEFLVRRLMLTLAREPRRASMLRCAPAFFFTECTHSIQEGFTASGCIVVLQYTVYEKLA